MFLESLIKISYLEDKTRCSHLLFEQIRKSKKKNDINIVKSFLLNFVEICFPGESFTILDLTNNKWKYRKVDNKEIEEFYLTIYKSIIQSGSNRSDCIKYLNALIKKALEKAGTTDCDIEMLSGLYDLIFEVYQIILLSEKDFPSHLMKIKEPAYFRLLLEKNNPSEKLISLYKKVLKESYRLISYSLYTCSKNTINDEIHEYMNMVQFFDLYPSLQELIEINEIHLVDVAIRIVNVIQVGKRNVQLLQMLSPLLENIKKIEIFDCEKELYDEILASTDVHEIYFTRNYFLALLILFYGTNNYRQKLDSLIDKLFYNCNDSFFAKRYKYSYILLELNKIKEEPQKAGNVINWSKRSFNETLEYLISMLNERITSIDKENMEQLRNSDVKEKLEKSITDEKIKIVEQFSNIQLRTRNKNDKLFFTLRSNFIFSKRVLCNDQRIIMCEMNYKDYSLPYLYGRFISLSSRIPINTIPDIKYLHDEDRLIISSHLMSYIYSNYNINFSNNSLSIRKKTIHFDWFNSKTNIIILEKDLKKCITLPEIPDDDLVINEKEEKNDIQISVNYQMQFYYSGNDNLKVYELIV